MTQILIAEDDQDIRELIVLTLQFNNFDVDNVEDGAAAVEQAQKKTIRHHPYGRAHA